LSAYGFQVIFYGRFWVIAEAFVDAEVEGESSDDVRRPAEASGSTRTEAGRTKKPTHLL
jgi:hypothetical protein